MELDNNELDNLGREEN